MHFAVLAVAASVALLARILYPFLRTYFSPLRNIPGPIAARFTDLWYLWHVQKGRFEWDNIELHRKHGTSLLHSYHAQATRQEVLTRSLRRDHSLRTEPVFLFFAIRTKDYLRSWRKVSKVKLVCYLAESEALSMESLRRPNNSTA